MKLRDRQARLLSALAAALAVGALAPGATNADLTPPAACVVTGAHARQHVAVSTRDGWTVESCVFDLYQHGRLVEQTGMGQVGAVQPGTG